MVTAFAAKELGFVDTRITYPNDAKIFDAKVNYAARLYIL